MIFEKRIALFGTCPAKTINFCLKCIALASPSSPLASKLQQFAVSNVIETRFLTGIYGGDDWHDVRG